MAGLERSHAFVVHGGTRVHSVVRRGKLSKLSVTFHTSRAVKVRLTLNLTAI
jgi:hypothetical protein